MSNAPRRAPGGVLFHSAGEGCAGEDSGSGSEAAPALKVTVMAYTCS